MRDGGEYYLLTLFYLIVELQHRHSIPKLGMHVNIIIKTKSCGRGRRLVFFRGTAERLWSPMK